MKKYTIIPITLFFICFMIQALPLEKVMASKPSNNIILLIDNSGSMRKTDPNKLSVVAASILIDTMAEDTNLSIIAFGDKAEAIHKLSEKPSKDILKKELEGLKFDNNSTNLKEGIEEALNQLEGTEGDKTIIVLSDGKEDPVGGITDQHMKELYSLSDKAHDKKVKIHSIGLSQYADEETLSRISFKTGGEYFPCENPSELFNVFSKILGSLNDFYTIEQFTTDIKKEREVKLSSYIDEVIIKVASYDNKYPMVNVTLDSQELSSNSSDDRYKIYRFNNDKNSTIKITSIDEGKNSIIVQIKSKGQININASNDNFSLPYKIPMNIEASFNIDKTIMGLHMDKLEEGKREVINKIGDAFRFTFKKDKAGQYPIVITAYDGEGNIIAVKAININVKSEVPFYYTSELPSIIVAERSFKVELKQQDDSKLDTVYGELYIDYGDSYEKIPLRFENGALYSDVMIKKIGEVKITTQINGVKDNEAFSYYLPYLRASVIEKPYVELESEAYKNPVKEGDEVKLNLNIKKNLTYENENILIYDNADNEIGKFELTPGTLGHISVPLKPQGKGENLSFKLKPESDIKVTDILNTNLRIVSGVYYYIYKVRVILISAGILLLLAVLLIAYGEITYRSHIKNYIINKTMYYKIGIGYTEKSLNLSLKAAKKANIRYLTLSNTSLGLEEENSDEAIGYFVLRYPMGTTFMEGWKYKLNKGKSFSVEYVTLEDQEITFNNEPVAGKIIYKNGVEIKFKKGKNNISISFS